MKSLRLYLLVPLLCAVLAPPALAQQEKEDLENDNIARKQRELQKRLENLEETIRLLAENLAEKEPENAQKLLDAWKSIRERLVIEDMDAVGEALQNGHLFGPFVKTGQIVDALIKILEDIIDQRRRESRPNLEKVKENLSKIRMLIEWQTKLKNRTENGGENLAPEQGELEGETGKLEKELETQKEKDFRFRKSARLVGQAKSQMNQAKQKLSEEKPGAPENQQKAIEKLTEAETLLQAVVEEGEYAQYYDFVQYAIAELKKMLREQLAANAKTLTLDKKARESELARADRIELRKLSDLERKMSAKALELARLFDEKKSFLFGGVLRDISETFGEISELLRDEDTGSYTRTLQDEVVDRIKQLIAALEDVPGDPPNPPPPPGPPGDGGDDSPPRPPLAELKLMKEIENEIHEKTKELNTLIEKSGKLNIIQKKMILRLAHRQSLLNEAMEKLREAMGGK